MSSELHKYIETSIEKKENLLNAEVINFPKDKNLGESRNSNFKSYDTWKINDKSNDDQLKGYWYMFYVRCLNSYGFIST